MKFMILLLLVSCGTAPLKEISLQEFNHICPVCIDRDLQSTINPDEAINLGCKAENETPFYDEQGTFHPVTQKCFTLYQCSLGHRFKVFRIQPYQERNTITY